MKDFFWILIMHLQYHPMLLIHLSRFVITSFISKKIQIARYDKIIS